MKIEEIPKSQITCQFVLSAILLGGLFEDGVRHSEIGQRKIQTSILGITKFGEQNIPPRVVRQRKTVNFGKCSSEAKWMRRKSDEKGNNKQYKNLHYHNM